jgi:hypothetical protein
MLISPSFAWLWTSACWLRLLLQGLALEYLSWPFFFLFHNSTDETPSQLILMRTNYNEKIILWSSEMMDGEHSPERPVAPPSSRLTFDQEVSKAVCCHTR